LPPFKESNSIIWGGAVGLVAALTAYASQTIPGASPMPQTLGQAALGGFFFGWLASEIRNWWGRKR
jgi:hypothetical protein